MTRLLVVRHAESEWNAAGRWQGRGDPPLSPRGREQAAAAVEAVRGRVEHVVTSTLVRARQTGEIVAAALGLDTRADPDLCEIDVGEWTGLTLAEVEERYGAELQAWRAGELAAPPGGEDKEAFLERVLRGLRAAVADGRPGLVIAHGGCIGRLERHLGVHAGRGTGHLSGRWLAVADGQIVADGDRVDLIGEVTPPAPEVR